MSTELVPAYVGLRGVAHADETVNRILDSVVYLTTTRCLGGNKIFAGTLKLESALREVVFSCIARKSAILLQLIKN